MAGVPATPSCIPPPEGPDDQLLCDRTMTNGRSIDGVGYLDTQKVGSILLAVNAYATA